MNIVDLLILLAAAAAAFRGYRRGLLGQVFELGGGFLGLLAGLALSRPVAAVFTSRPGIEGAIISLATVFAALAIGQMLGFLVGYKFRHAARHMQLVELDATLGLAFSVLVTLILFWLIGSMLVHGPSRQVARALRQSTVLTALSAALPTPPDVVSAVQQYLDRSGFPQVFAGLPAEIGPPVKLPSNAQALRAVRAADQSTVRVTAPACGGTLLGTGWVAASDTVVTNAHVVAGASSVMVHDAAGHHAGRVVLFDDETDIAVIRTDGLGGPPLSLTTRDLPRGTKGATLGYPGSSGGRLVWRRAAVRAHFEATGRDIYGTSRVQRDVYEIHSPVRQGESGGPFVLPNGTVGGMVFAASSTDGETGYALSGREVLDEVRAGAARTSPVSTGACTH
ncbi:MAG: MarP family serine protease [Actinomycetota bacterium]|nr:MarP family serine protease [Actinomycetota bacterium]